MQKNADHSTVLYDPPLDDKVGPFRHCYCEFEQLSTLYPFYSLGGGPGAERSRGNGSASGGGVPTDGCD